MGMNCSFCATAVAATLNMVRPSRADFIAFMMLLLCGSLLDGDGK
jgi:hypothetical protein